MATYVTLVKWTEQGIKNVKDTVKRAEDVTNLAEKMGGRMTSLLWTQGRYDLIGIFEAPDEEIANAFAIAVGMSGSARTETLRAFSAQEMQSILSRLP